MTGRNERLNEAISQALCVLDLSAAYEQPIAEAVLPIIEQAEKERDEAHQAACKYQWVPMCPAWIGETK